MDDGAQREMTLDEFVSSLGPQHRARRELAELRAKLEACEKELEQISARLKGSEKLKHDIGVLLFKEREKTARAIEIAKKLVGHVRKIPVGISTVEFSDFNEVNRLRDQLDEMETETKADRWPCQDLHGGKMPFINVDENGMCNHEACKPPELDAMEKDGGE